MVAGISEYLANSRSGTPRLAFAGDASGRTDDPWHYLQHALAELGATELYKRQQLIRRLLRDSGVAHHGHRQLRPWLLDPVPLAIPSEQWRTAERGLQQRAELLSCLFRDLYGAQRTLRQGLLPAEWLLADPGFLRPCIGQPLPGDRYRLPFHAADLARDATGTLLVLADRLQSLDGLGLALENRIVLSRVLPSLFRDARVHRLALFFRTLRQQLHSLAETAGAETRVLMLTSGPDGRDYFEHAYLARYLGYPLVQGDDLTVRDGRVMLRTLDGLLAVDVILRAVADRDCDALELAQYSRCGVAGLLQAVRQRRIAVANPLGSGVLENPALSAHLPGLCRMLLGEELLLPSPETFWCGDARLRGHVLSRLDRLVIHESGGLRHDARQMDRTRLDALRQRIVARPWRFTAREPFIPAVTPTLGDGGPQHRPVVLRTFLVATGDDYLAMPGGLGRLAEDSESIGRGGVGKDAWVLASEPIQPLSLLPSDSSGLPPVQTGDLPSRVAENLFWLGRYAERSDSLIRLLRVVLLELLEHDTEDAGESSCLPDLLRAVTWLTETFPGFVGEGAEQRLAAPDRTLAELLLAPQTVGSLVFSLNAMLNAARAVRERISPDLWRVVAGIDDTLAQLQGAVASDLDGICADPAFLNQALEQLDQLLTASAAFTGLALDSMTHGQGWRFLMIGRRLERTQQLLRLLRPTLTRRSVDARLLEAVLNICDSLMTYRSRYRTRLRADAVLELLLLDESNPRALGYQLRHLQHDIDLLPGQQPLRPHRSPEQRISLEVLTRLRLIEPPQLLQDAAGQRPLLDRLLEELGVRLTDLGEALADGYFRHAERPQQLVNYRSDG